MLDDHPLGSLLIGQYCEGKNHGAGSGGQRGRPRRERRWAIEERARAAMPDAKSFVHVIQEHEAAAPLEGTKGHSGRTFPDAQKLELDAERLEVTIRQCFSCIGTFALDHCHRSRGLQKLTDAHERGEVAADMCRLSTQENELRANRS